MRVQDLFGVCEWSLQSLSSRTFSWGEYVSLVTSCNHPPEDSKAFPVSSFDMSVAGSLVILVVDIVSRLPGRHLDLPNIRIQPQCFDQEIKPTFLSRGGSETVA
jgi:hypothetical protein